MGKGSSSTSHAPDEKNENPKTPLSPRNQQRPFSCYENHACVPAQMHTVRKDETGLPFTPAPTRPQQQSASTVVTRMHPCAQPLVLKHGRSTVHCPGLGLAPALEYHSLKDDDSERVCLLTPGSRHPFPVTMHHVCGTGPGAPHVPSCLRFAGSSQRRIPVPALQRRKLGLRAGNVPETTEPGLASKGQSRAQGGPCAWTWGTEAPLHSTSCKGGPWL